MNYFEKQKQTETDLCFRHPWFNMIYNYLIAGCMIALVVSLVIWGVNVHTENKAAEMTATALASWQADQDAQRTAEAEELAALKASEDYVMKQEAEAVAKAFYGIHLFIDKYRYDEDDLVTYARCMFNRADKSKDLIGVVTAKDQFTGYRDDNPVLSEYYNLALKLVEEWHHETIKPCDVSFQFAELTSAGIYLKQDLHADGYARRWHS